MMKNLQLQVSSMTDAQVEGYLWDHPDFFNEHLELLEHMSIPHPSGNAVSLVSKQLEIFRNRHQDMESQLNALINVARENDALCNRMHELTLAMLDSATVEEVLANLNQVLFDCFLADFVAVKIFQEQGDAPINNLFISPDDEQLQHFHKILGNNHPKCSRPTLAQAKFLFGEDALDVESCAFVPLIFTKLEGMLVIGARQKNRFHPNMGNLFLTQISEIVGTRLISLLHEQHES